MSSLQELFDKPPLSKYVDFFVSAGFDDLEFILSMKESEWDHMLDEVAKSAKKKTEIMLSGHRMKILYKLKEAKARKYPEADEEDPLKKPAQRDDDRERSANVTELVELQTAGLQLQICLQGFYRLVGKKWGVCAGFGVTACVLSFVLYALYRNLQESYTNQTKEEYGAWKFCRILFITGFVLSAIGLLACLATLASDPESRELPDCSSADSAFKCECFQMNCACCQGEGGGCCDGGGGGACEIEMPDCCGEEGNGLLSCFQCENLCNECKEKLSCRADDCCGFNCAESCRECREYLSKSCEECANSCRGEAY